MKKLNFLIIFLSFLSCLPLKADWDFWALKFGNSTVVPDDGGGVGVKRPINFYTVDSSTGESTLRTSRCWYESYQCQLPSDNDLQFNASNGNLVIKKGGLSSQASDYQMYNLEENTWTDLSIDTSSWKDSYSSTLKVPNLTKNNNGSAIIKIDNTKIYEYKNDGSVQIGSDTNDIDITAEGLNIDGNPLITKKDNGEIHIGKNSLITKSEEETLSDGRKVQPLYAKDADGNKIPINIDGSKLLIDGVEVTAAGDSAQVTTNKNNISTNTSNISSNDTDISALQGLISTKSGSTKTTRIGDSTKNILEIGPTTNPTTIDQSGISVSGGNLIKKDSDGNIHIGKNSFVIGDDVLNGAHPIWAEDENGTKIPLNIYGSDLQINGVSVQGQINTNKSNIKNLGSGVAGSTALTAALTALPQTSKESKLSCGVGTGAYSSRYAVGFGCASKVNERVDINAGGSYVFGGSKSYGDGTLDNGVIKAGFVFKLGELNTPTQISMKDTKKMEAKIESLEEKNKQLLSRLERLEKIALNEIKSNDLVIYKLK